MSTFSQSGQCWKKRDKVLWRIILSIKRRKFENVTRSMRNVSGPHAKFMCTLDLYTFLKCYFRGLFSDLVTKNSL